MKTDQEPLRNIYLFGALRVFEGGNLLPLSGEKIQDLLAYLVLNPRLPHRREKLADLLYPDAPFERVSRNFSDTLYRLQKALGNDWIAIDRNTVALHLDEHLWVDVWHFERLALSDQQDDIQQAVDLYTGDLLPELYDDWLIPERELRRNQFLSALEKLAALQEGQRNFRQALITLRRLVSAEPLHEPAHQSYLRLLGRMQRYGEALAHYEYLRKLLRSELDAEPLAETRLIAESIENERHLATTWIETEERTHFVGRKAERATLLATVETMIKGQGGIIAIEGEAGIGKSRLLREVAASIRWRGATLLQGVVSQMPSASPFSPLTEALTPLINSPRGVQIESLLRDETLTALALLNPAWSGRAALADLPSDLSVNRFHDALRSLGGAIAQLTPTILAFDDLQWADPTFWLSLEALAQGLLPKGAMLILLYRRPDIEHTPGWEVIQAWDRAGILKSCSLQPLSVEDVSQLIADTDSFDPVEVHAGTGGNPFHIQEWLAAPTAEKTTRQDPIANRLKSLSPTARLALESAAVLGENIPYRIWIEISALPPLTLAGHSDELTAQNWLQPSPSGFAFSHDLIRATVYEQIEHTRREAMHERSASVYISFEPDNLRARAFHLDRAGHNLEAAHAYRLAAQQDQRRFAFTEAQQALERALSLMPTTPTEERLETDLELVGLCDITGDLEIQATASDDALHGALAVENDSLLYRSLLAAGHVADDAGNIEKAEEHLTAALELARRMGDYRGEGEVHYRLMILTAHQGRWSEALERATRALAQARTAGDRVMEGKALRGIGIIKSELEQPAEAIAWQEQSVEVLSSLGRTYDTWVSQLNLMTLYSELGMWDHTRETANELITNLDAAGARVKAANVRLNLVDVHLATGDAEAAGAAIREIPDDGKLLGARGVVVVRQNLALIAEAEGNFAEAEKLHRETLQVAEASKASDYIAAIQHDLGAMLVCIGRPLEAAPQLESAHAKRLKEGNSLDLLKSEAFLGLALIGIGERARAEELAKRGWKAFEAGVPIGDKYQNWLWALFRLLEALGQRAQANEVLRTAYTELQRQAQYIGDPNVRRRFFEQVQINRDIVEAHDRLHQTSRVIEVSLARNDAPLGRLLRQDEFVPVHWTISAPEDEAISDKSERRHYRLKRLLLEAENQSAAPTDEELARALGVSRRTILRDMQALRQEIPRPPTRKRKT